MPALYLYVLVLSDPAVFVNNEPAKRLLNTDYLDVYFMNHSDSKNTVKEIMRSMVNLEMAGNFAIGGE